MIFIACSVIVIFSIMFMYYLFTTYTPQGCKDYCAEHSKEMQRNLQESVTADILKIMLIL